MSHENQKHFLCSMGLRKTAHLAFILCVVMTLSCATKTPRTMPHDQAIEIRKGFLGGRTYLCNGQKFTSKETVNMLKSQPELDAQVNSAVRNYRASGVMGLMAQAAMAGMLIYRSDAGYEGMSFADALGEVFAVQIPFYVVGFVYDTMGDAKLDRAVRLYNQGIKSPSAGRMPSAQSDIIFFTDGEERAGIGLRIVF